MNFAREGYLFIVVAGLAAAAAYAAAFGRRSWPLWLLAFLLTLIALWVAYFFRDPERLGDRGDRLVIAPADGKVVDVRETDEPTFLHGRATRISIFMNVFNCHVNRSPVSGTIVQQLYSPGLFLNAELDKASDDNERNALVIETTGGRIGVVQIAGLVARRIVSFVKPGEALAAGERFGLIRFGSRLDVYLPLDARPLVGVGQNAIAGETVLVDLKAQEPARTFRTS